MPPKRAARPRKAVDYHARALKSAATRARNRAAAHPPPDLRAPQPPDAPPAPEPGPEIEDAAGPHPPEAEDENPEGENHPPEQQLLLPPAVPPVAAVVHAEALINDAQLAQFRDADPDRQAAVLHGIARLFQHLNNIPEDNNIIHRMS